MLSLLISVDLRIPESLLGALMLGSLWASIVSERHAVQAARVLKGCVASQLLLSYYLAAVPRPAVHWGLHLLELGGAAALVSITALLQRHRYALFGG